MGTKTIRWTLLAAALATAACGSPPDDGSKGGSDMAPRTPATPADALPAPAPAAALKTATFALG